MKILFSPSEAKTTQSPINSALEDSLCFNNLYTKRVEVLEKYSQFLKNSTQKELSKLLGLKKEVDILEYKELDILNSPLQLAILRYSGVGFKYLDFTTLSDEAKKNILNSTIIFSNLFGPILAHDSIPLYKLKQGEVLGDFNQAKHYKQYFSDTLDDFIGDDLLIDLRAGYYEKFYAPKQRRITLKFLKDGKALSHFAKAYRGLALRALAMENPKNEEEFKNMMIPDLQIKEIQIKGKNHIYIYDILS